MISSQLLADIQNSQTSEDNMTQQLGTGDNILTPSDNVMGTVRSMDYQVNISSDGQYENNIDNASNNLNETNTVLTSISDTLSSITGILNSATSSSGQSSQLASQVSQLQNQLLGYANTNIGGDYLLSGFQTGTQPYAAGTSDYQGDTGLQNVPIGENATIAQNVPGTSVLSYTQTKPYTATLSNGDTATYTNGGTTVAGEPIVNVSITDANHNPVSNFSFSNAIQLTGMLSTAVANNDTTTIDALQYPFSQMQNQVNTAQADVSASLNGLKDQTTNLTQSTTITQNSLSTIQSADTASLGVEIQQANTDLQALYSASAEILPLSLFSFLQSSSTG